MLKTQFLRKKRARLKVTQRFSWIKFCRTTISSPIESSATQVHQTSKRRWQIFSQERIQFLCSPKVNTKKGNKWPLLQTNNLTFKEIKVWGTTNKYFLKLGVPLVICLRNSLVLKNNSVGQWKTLKQNQFILLIKQESRLGKKKKRLPLKNWRCKLSSKTTTRV